MNALQIQQLTVGELKILISEVFKEELEKRLKQTEKPPKYISRDEAAEILSISTNTLYAWTLRGDLKAYKFGSTIKYLKHEVEEAGPNIIRRRKNGGRHD